MNESRLREIIIEQRESFPRVVPNSIERELLVSMKKAVKLPHAVVISGIRRSGKSTLLRHIAEKYYAGDNFYYINFEDERLINFTIDDFNLLYELFIELNGKSNTFFIDEIQNVLNWESFIRRMYDRGFKFYITGSNASLLSKEIGTKLTGRHHSVELFPFSFPEYLLFKNVDSKSISIDSTEKRALLKRHFRKYLKTGGMPELLQYGQKEILKGTYDDILYRDIAARYSIGEVRTLREISLFVINNISQQISFNKMKSYFNLGSVNTVIKYISYLENSYLFFVINKFSYSVKKQLIAPKKIYCIDNGFGSLLGFQFSENRGHFLENLVLIHLKRLGKEIFYYITNNGKEVDFLIRGGKNKFSLIQVSYSMKNRSTLEREVTALETAMEELDVPTGLILTEDEKDTIKKGKKKIEIVPVYEWLLTSGA